MQLFMKRPYHFMSLSIVCLAAMICAPPTAAKEKSMGNHRPVFENPPSVAPPIGAYSHVARVAAGSELIVLAGQVGIMPDGTLPESVEEQYAQALRNVVALLASQGAKPTDIVKVNYYLVKPMDLGKIRDTRTKIIGDARPPSTLVYVPALAAPQYLVEIEAWAVKPTAR
jgi:2-iminobutanoate/2-iminopropanoate deaminase